MSKELRSLIHTVQKKRIQEQYAKTPAKKLLYLILHEIEMKKHYGRFRNWELMVELLAKWTVQNVDLTLSSLSCKSFHGLDMKQNKDLYDHIDNMNLFNSYYAAAKKEPWDHIGEVYTELGLVDPGQNMTPRAVVEFMLKLTFGNPWRFEAKLFSYNSYRDYLLRYYTFHHVRPAHLRPMEYPMQTQLDPCVGTGRFLLVASWLYPKAPLVQFGIEISLALYRACLVNMALFSKHAYSIICADALRLDTEKSGPSSPLWDLGNRWVPPDVSAFYWKPIPPFQRYMKMRGKTK